MSESDSSDGLHLAAPTLCIQMSQERLREGRRGMRKGGRQRKSRERVQLSQTAGDVQLSRRLDYSLKSALGGRGERERKTARKRELNRNEDRNGDIEGEGWRL